MGGMRWLVDVLVREGVWVGKSVVVGVGDEVGKGYRDVGWKVRE